MMLQRPTHKELINKIREAGKFVSEKNVFIINVDAVACDALNLEYLIETDLLEDLSCLLDEIVPDHYAGQNPPEKSYEQKIKNLDLFAFKIDSLFFGSEVYLKFALSGDGLFLVSLHRNRKPGGGKRGR